MAGKNRFLRILEQMLARLIKARDRESLLSDLEEIYLSLAEERGRAAANVWYLKQILVSILPVVGNKFYWFGLMFKNYCVLAFRKYARQRTMTLINVAGLTIGLAAFIVIELYISYETSFDTFHDNSRNIYRIQHNTYRKGALLTEAAKTVPAVAVALKQNFSEVEDYAQVSRSFLEYAAFAYNDEIAFRAQRIFIATPSFLRLFDFPLLNGDPQTALSEPLQAVLTASTARRYFGTEDPLGKTIIYNKKHPFKISGVCEDVPANSHIQFDVLLSFASIPYAAPRVNNALEAPQTDWQSNSFYTYILLRKDTDPRSFETKVNHWLGETLAENWQETGSRMELRLQPLEDIHLYSRLPHELEPDSQGNGEAIRVLKLIAVFILVLAWVNTINMTTARALERAREVGIRKVAGAYRQQIIKQFLFEYLGLNFMAAVLAVLLVLTFLPYFSRATYSDLSFRFLFQSESLSTVLWLLLGGGFMAGMYPAVLLSAFRPANVMKGNLTRRAGGVRVRRFLVTLQLTVSVALIAGTLIVYRQIDFMLNKDPGIDIERSFVIRAPGTNEPPPEVFSSHIQAFRVEVSDFPDVLSFATTTAVPGEEVLWGHVFRRLEDHPQDTQKINLVGIDHRFIPAFGIRLLAGRNFSETNPGDEEAVILNGAAVRILDYQDPEDAVKGKVVWRGRERPVIGVIENYNQLSPKESPIPLVYLYSPNRGFVTLKIRSEELSRTVAWVKDRWQHHFPGIPFDYFFLDEFFHRHFSNDHRFGRVFALFSGLTIVIACLGLFALASYNAVQRTKEIGIRKAMGASIRDVYLLLSKEFLRLAAAAGILAIPFTYFQMQRWLENYVFRIPLQWWFFAASWAGVVLVVLLTISYQSLRAAAADPVDALRHE
jgi:putative ABC transport system permease protein